MYLSVILFRDWNYYKMCSIRLKWTTYDTVFVDQLQQNVENILGKKNVCVVLVISFIFLLKSFCKAAEAN